MHSNIMRAATLGLAASLADPVAAFWRMSCPGRILSERADPIVFPGVVAPHVHTISGSNGFGFTENYDQAKGGSCTSCPIKQDMSNYWTPKLYYQAENGSFIDVPQAGDGLGIYGGMTVYYQQRPSYTGEQLLAFPKDFRMVAGDPFKRNFTGDFAARAVSFACLDYNGPPTAETNKLPDRNCPNGLRAQVYFPSCWDGVRLDTPDHKSHMSYYNDTSYDNGHCPPSHPKHMISIFYEIIYQTNLFADKWHGSGQPFVFAQGDATGYGFHGDFLNGWDVATLQAATNDCNDGGGDMTKCSHFKFYTSDENHACTVPPSVDEPITGVLDKLPGCNPVTHGPAPAVPVANCPVTPIGKPKTYYTDLTTSLGYKYIGCGSDNVAARTLTQDFTWSPDMTPAMCVKYCKGKGYAYAGLEYADQCYCGSTLPADRAPVAGVQGNCFSACAGDKKQYCGGGSALSLYQACPAGGSCANSEYGAKSKNKGRSERHLSEHRHAVVHGDR
ncbi:hypothetical protein LTR50_000400 [Elasticomyces elasticus]|nr:hypothetical protein LTR50_000400 [Elasticomyces elasticus]